MQPTHIYTNRYEIFLRLIFLFFHCILQISLKENSFDFEEFVFSFRKVDWVRFTIIDVYNGSGGVGIQEIEFYNGMCKQSKLLKKVAVNSK